MSGDEELRRRLREIPGPRAGLDVDAVVASARRRRRPKVAALTAAATGAGVLIVAPFVVPGLSPLEPRSGPASVGGADQQAPTEQDASGDGVGQQPGAPEPAAEGSLAAVCQYPAMRAETGIVAAFADDPADGAAGVELAFPEAGGEVRVLGVAVAQVAVGGEPLRIVAAPDVAAFDGAPVVGDASAPVGGGTIVLPDVGLVDAPALECGVDAPAAPAPLLLIDVDGRRIAVVGEPWERVR